MTNQHPTTENEKKAWLRLAYAENVGPITFSQLLKRFKTAQEAIKQLPRVAARGGRKRPLHIPDISDIDNMLLKCDSQGVVLLPSYDTRYPELLKTLEDRPPVLSAKGRLELLQKPLFSIVGSRNASALGQQLAFEWAESLGEANLVIVSGMAQGIDASAHRGSLRHGTVAVLAGGVDKVYPQENESLYNMLAAQGVVIAEMPLGTPIQNTLFPRRNRIIAGASWGVLVIEAAMKSGSLLTAHYAARQGRHVFAVPGHPKDPRSAGTSQLIRDGATLARTTQDILDEWPTHAREKGIASDVFTYDTDVTSDTSIEMVRTDLLRLLSPTPTSIEVLCTQTNAPPGTIRAALVELELAGRVFLTVSNNLMASLAQTNTQAS